MQRSRKRLHLSSESIRVLSGVQLEAAVGGLADESIVYNCATNTSIMRSCFEQSCGPSGYYVCPMAPAG